jgi:hypothetical protein
MVAQAQTEQNHPVTHLSYYLAISFYRFISLAAFNRKTLRLPFENHSIIARWGAPEPPGGGT